MTEGAPKFAWLEKHGKTLMGIAAAVLIGGYMFQQVNPDSVKDFWVNEEKKACALRAFETRVETRECIRTSTSANEMYRCVR